MKSAGYALGHRPKIPAQVERACSDLASLISEMWDSDFRKRPPMIAVVRRLKGASEASFDDFVSIDAAATATEGEDGLLVGMEGSAAAIVAMKAENDALKLTVTKQAAQIKALEQALTAKVHSHPKNRGITTES